MAINQFTISLLPKQWVDCHGFDISSLYTEDGVFFDDAVVWKSFETNHDIKELMLKVFKHEKISSEDTFIGEASEDNDVHVLFEKDRIEGIKFRINLYNTEKELVEDIITIANQLNCFFFYPELKIVTQPNIVELLNAVKQSVAWRFAKDPIRFLDSLS